MNVVRQDQRDERESGVIIIFGVNVTSKVIRTPKGVEVVISDHTQHTH